MGKAYLRFSYCDLVSQVKASVKSEKEVKLLDAITYSDFFSLISVEGLKLLDVLDKDEGVFLLEVDSNFEYEISFEYANMDRWKISKLDGGTGIPEGK